MFNPSFTSPYVSELPGIDLDAGLYYVVVDGYGSVIYIYARYQSSTQQSYQEPVMSITKVEMNMIF